VLAPRDKGVYELLLGEAQRVLNAIDEVLWIVNDTSDTLRACYSFLRWEHPGERRRQEKEEARFAK
jgi:hypothetical protein